MYGFLLTPRWLVLHLVVVALAVLFINLGLWQLRRHDQRVEHNDLIASRVAADPEPYERLTRRYDLAAPAHLDTAAAYRRTRLTGRFDTANEVLLRSRSRGGKPGWHVLTPLRFDSGRGALLVDRGWVPYALDNPPVALAAPPEGEVSVVGTLTPPPVPRGRFGARDPAVGRLEAVFWIDPERLEEQLPYGLEPLYLVLSTQTPAQETLPLAPEPPELMNGPHLGYAIQWFSFTLIGLVGYGALIRQSAREGGRRRVRVPRTRSAPDRNSGV